jgi:hypothetical protein
MYLRIDPGARRVVPRLSETRERSDAAAAARHTGLGPPPHRNAKLVSANWRKAAALGGMDAA